jgi:DNA integrity scanning protein DisA with diadenylate cyclase activity/GAF domain-containing protein
MRRSVGPEGEYLRACHAEACRFNNSANVPNELKKDHPDVNCEGLWRSYLEQKFTFFNMKPTGQPRLREMRNRVMKGALPIMRTFLKDWEDSEGQELRAYLYRAFQLPTPTIWEEWYDQRVTSVREWCKQRDAEIKGLEAIVSHAAHQESQLADDLSNDYVLGLFSQMCVSGISQRLSYFQTELSEPAVRYPDVLSTFTEKCASILNDVRGSVVTERSPPQEEHRLHPDGQKFLQKLLLFLLNQLYSRGFNETEIIHVFLEQLKEFYNCDVADYLDATEDGGKLLWRVATVKPQDLSKEFRDMPESELRTAIQRDESYGRAVGITGSILLLKDFSIWRHIGSNDLRDDPRQSIVHRSAYERDLYPKLLTGGRIQNFWAFPILKGSKLKGIIRVVNRVVRRSESSSKRRKLRKGGWSYLTRVELAVIAFWFSQFLDAARPLLDRRLDFIELLERDKRVSELLQRLNADWLDKDVLKQFLEHLRKDINKREENRRIGCCIGIVCSETVSACDQLEPFPVLNASEELVHAPFDGLDNFHDAVNPNLGAYFFRQNGKFIKIAALHLKENTVVGQHPLRSSVWGLDAIKTITAATERLVFLHLDRGHRSIHVYSGGTLVAEIHISEKEGTWAFRYPQDLLRVMERARAGIDKEVIRVVWEASLEMMTQGHGALFVIGDDSTEPYELRPARFPYSRTEKITDFGSEYLAEFAKPDGAVFIDRKGYVRELNTIVYPKSDDIIKYTLFPGRGGRHQTAELICRRSPKSIVVVISENRGLNVVRNGEILLSTDPNRAAESGGRRAGAD